MDFAIALCGAVIVGLAAMLIVAVRDCVRAEHAQKRIASQSEDYCSLLSKLEREVESLRRTINTRDEQITDYERRMDSIMTIAQTKRNEEWQREMESDIESIIEAAKNLEERWEAEA